MDTTRWFTSPKATGYAFAVPVLSPEHVFRDARRLVHSFIEQKSIPVGPEVEDFDREAQKVPIEEQHARAIDRDLKVVSWDRLWSMAKDMKMTVAGWNA